ncbi:MAG: hypothetical protein QMB62_06225 [Oscillospiraceae bacterium]
MPESEISIKKRSRNHIYFGVSKESGEVLSIDQVPSGLTCNCVCAACGVALEARKGTQRIHHFAHVSNYECLYSNEVSLYMIAVDFLKDEKKNILPPVMVSFPSKATEKAEDARLIVIDDIEYSCPPEAYPPIVILTVHGYHMRLILNFGHYFDKTDLSRFEIESREHEWACLCMDLPAIQNKSAFDIAILKKRLVEDTDHKYWLRNRNSERWLKRYEASAFKPKEHGMGYLCPIHIGFYKGQYSARWVDCSNCEFNIAETPACLCLAKSGISQISDFQRPKEELQARIERLRMENERAIRESQERLRQTETKSRRYPAVKTYTQQRPNANTPVIPPLTNEEKREAGYKEICDSFSPDSQEQTLDSFGQRWLQCRECGRLFPSSEMQDYGGVNNMNRGLCVSCSRRK